MRTLRNDGLRTLSSSSRLAPVVAAICLAGGGCSLLEPSEGEVYVLSTISSQPLPRAVLSWRDVNGRFFEYQVVQAVVRLRPLARYEQNLLARHVWDGVPADTLIKIRVVGRYERLDTAIVVRYKEPIFGSIAGRLYHVLDNGRVLRGIEGIDGVGG